MPTPVSHFDFHEGSGSATTDIIGGATITYLGGGAAFVAGGTRGYWEGGVGPAGTQANWTVVFESTHSVRHGGVDNFGHDADQPWFNFNADGNPGPWSPDQFSSIPIPLNTRSLIAYVFTAANDPPPDHPSDIVHSRVYVNGVLGLGYFSSAYTTDFSDTWALRGSGEFILHSVRLYDVALTAAEVAALSTPPGEPAAADLTPLVLEVEIDARAVAVSAPQATVEAAVGTPTEVNVAGTGPVMASATTTPLVLEVEVDTRTVAASAPQATMEAAVGTPTEVDVAGAGPVVVLVANAGLPGLPGPPGLVPRGAWDPAATYLPGDVVTRSGSAWLALAESTGVDPAAGAGIVGALFGPSMLFFSSATYSVASSFTVDQDCSVTELDVEQVFSGVAPSGTIGIASDPYEVGIGVVWLGKGTGDIDRKVLLDNEVTLHAGTTYWFVIHAPATGGLTIENVSDVVGTHMAPGGEFLYGTPDLVTHLDVYILPVKLIGSLVGETAWTLFVQGAP